MNTLINKTIKMKKILLLLVLFTSMVNAQIVNIPDANFKAKLIALGIDSNGSGEIDAFETTFVNQLHLENSNINNLIGIAAFTNLNGLYCENNNLTFLDLSSNVNLTFLNCRLNQIAFLNLSNNSSLTDVLADSNQLNGINISNNPSLDVLWVANNNLTTLNTASCVNLTELWCSSNNLTSLDISGSIAISNLQCDDNQLTSLNFGSVNYLTRLYCMNNQLSTLDLSGFVNLNFVYCEGNQLTSLNVNGATALHTLSCGQNLLSSIDVSSLSGLVNFFISDNNLTSLDVSGLSQLMQFNCINNQLNNLNITGCNNLNVFNCEGNQLTNLNFNPGMDILAILNCANNLLTTLDLTNLIGLTTSNCSNNQLITLFIKNGVFTPIDFNLNPNIQFICCDENETGEVQSLLNTYGYTSCIANSYCSFAPGGNYNTITGSMIFDSNNNGCDANDIPQPNIRVNINDGTNTGAAFTNTNGNYTFYTQAGSFDITPNVENPTWFNFTPATASIPFADNNNNITTQDFCIAANGVHHDVEMVIVPITPARPGFDAVYKLVYKNNGNQIETFVAPNFYYNDTVLDLVSTSLVPAVSGIGYIQWFIPSLLPFQSGEITITLNVNAPTDIPAVNIGDILEFSSIIDLPLDENWVDNNFVYNQTVVGSFDPNDITCLEGESVAPSEIGKYLHYVINFENTGNFPAENVVVKTIVDSTKFDINSLQLLNASNPVNARITGNVVEFIFENIQLGGPGGHGHVLLKVKSKNSLVPGDDVAKSAGIYFDYNAPVDTGIATTVFQSLSNSVFVNDDSVTVFPNPTSSIININSNFNIKKVELFDAQGRILEINMSDAKKLDISEKSNGIYFLKITTEKGSKVEKLIKE